MSTVAPEPEPAAGARETPAETRPDVAGPAPDSAPEAAGGGDPPARAASDAGAPNVVMTVESVTYDLGEAAPVVRLLEAEAPYRSLEVPIALPEAVALANALENRAGRRPSTHELFTTVLGELRGEIVAARVARVDNGVFFGELVLMTPRGRRVVDCRVSDALILALRQPVVAPVLCEADVLSAADPT
ncbi:MAG: bifunctional nuclease domain-containing protein [Acidimicrobiales bacterium]